MGILGWHRDEPAFTDAELDTAERQLKAEAERRYIDRYVAPGHAPLDDDDLAALAAIPKNRRPGRPTANPAGE